jgi:hypothetical protein
MLGKRLGRDPDRRRQELERQWAGGLAAIGEARDVAGIEAASAGLDLPGLCGQGSEANALLLPHLV